MRIQLLLPSVPGFSNRNVVLAAHSCCSHPRNFFTGFIVNHFFSNKTPLFIEGGNSFLSAPDEKTEKLISFRSVGTTVTGLFFFPKEETIACRIPLDNHQSQFDVMAIKKGQIIRFCLQNNGVMYAKKVNLLFKLKLKLKLKL